MYHRNVTAISAALVFTLAAAGAVAQGLPDQGEGMVDGEFLKPPASSFVSTSDWEYRFSDPGSGWEAVPSGGSGWSQTALLGFHGGGTMPGDVGSFESWPAGQSTLWARTTFTVGAEDLDDVMFWGRWDDDITVYVNGVLAVERDEWTPSNRYLGLSEAARLTLTASQPNLLAVRVTNTDGGRHMNLQPVVAPDLAQLPVWGSVKNDDVVHLVGFVRAQMLQHGVPAGALSIFEADGVNENNYTELVNVGIGYMDKQFQRQSARRPRFVLPASTSTQSRPRSKTWWTQVSSPGTTTCGTCSPRAASPRLTAQPIQRQRPTRWRTSTTATPPSWVIRGTQIFSRRSA